MRKGDLSIPETSNPSNCAIPAFGFHNETYLALPARIHFTPLRLRRGSYQRRMVVGESPASARGIRAGNCQASCILGRG